MWKTSSYPQMDRLLIIILTRNPKINTLFRSVIQEGMNLIQFFLSNRRNVSPFGTKHLIQRLVFSYQSLLPRMIRVGRNRLEPVWFVLVPSSDGMQCRCRWWYLDYNIAKHFENAALIVWRFLLGNWRTKLYLVKRSVATRSTVDCT